ncbi:hypothetical protein [Nocardioides sp. WS12]|uniref:hypothetical protein n=1 Tax=Nocardioides sp. WS12 TaxID=2486272 RepID=UPI0015F8CF83|nr:hypothetical protein [Nocardioides sp. WS12]
MNTTTRTALRLLIATPLAASALAIGGFAGAAHAETPGFDPNPGPVIVQPHDDEDPRPEGPGDIALPEDDEDPRPEGPGDITNPEDEDEPEVPDDKDGPNPGDDEPEVPGDKDGPNPGDEPEDVPADEVPGEDVPADKKDKGNKGGKKDSVVEEGDAVVVPTRIDAGAGPVEEEGSGLTWLIVGGGAVAAAGSVLARKRTVATR